MTNVSARFKEEHYSQHVYSLQRSNRSCFTTLLTLTTRHNEVTAQRPGLAVRSGYSCRTALLSRVHPRQIDGINTFLSPWRTFYRWDRNRRLWDR